MINLRLHPIEDVYTSTDAEKPITGGLFTVDKADEPFVYTYGYHEVSPLPSILSSLLYICEYEHHSDLSHIFQQTKIILEGEIWLEAVGPEKGSAEIIKAKAGDVLRIAKGTVVSFTSPSSGKGEFLFIRSFGEKRG